MPHVYTRPTDNFTVLHLQQLWTDSGSEDWLGRITLFDRGDGVWFAFYRAGDSHSSADGQVHQRRSTNEGITWSDEDEDENGDPINDFPLAGEDGSDGVVFAAVRAANDDILLFSPGASVAQPMMGSFICRSTDEGENWAYDADIMDTTDFWVEDAILVGTTLYAIGWRSGTPGTTLVFPGTVELLKSEDHGATWSVVSVVMDTTVGANECTVVHLGGTELLAVGRDDAEVTTFQARSLDMGVTWEAVTDIGGMVGCIQKPILHYEDGRVYMWGRDRVSEFVQWTATWYSDNKGRTWSSYRRWHPSSFSDAAYCDVLRREDGSWYGMTYVGTTNDTTIWEAVYLGI